jgi:Xaa-Pro aminopeptidase
MEQYAAEDQAKGCKVEQYQQPELVARLGKKLGGINSAGFDDLNFKLLDQLGKLLPELNLVQKQDLIWKQRRYKDTAEIKLMERAGKLADHAMEALRGKLAIGVTEYELAATASYAMMVEGAESHGFDPIVASGPTSAYPHSSPTKRRVRIGDLIVVDIGATHRGYRSDITRTFIAGYPDVRQMGIYEAVLRAHDAAYAVMRDGASCKGVDAAARQVIEEAGHGPEFVHSLGHGVGLEVHEPPAVSSRSEETLGTGDVVSDEPGIYIHGYGGVRIEDTVLITSGGPKRMTNSPRGIDWAIF